MKQKKTPPRRSCEREGQKELTAATLPPPLSWSKPFDAVEKNLSLALDALLVAIDTYREKNQ